jgi:phosphoglycolate phosphatase-like HAD superfamily hydrolase
MRALVLDFDGVIADSAREAFVVALRTYCELHPFSTLASVLERMDPAHPEADALYAAFVDVMPLGNRAEDYAVALRALERGVALEDQPGYDAFKGQQDVGELRDFHRRFYQVRGAWSRKDPAGWLRLMAPYPELLDLLRRRAGEVDLAVATAKDRRSVRDLLKHYGVDALFPEGSVFDKETGKSKDAHLAHLRDLLALPYEAMTFVDDKVNHLEVVEKLGVRCALAAWGYNGPREQQQAREKGMLVCTLADVEASLFAA